MQRPTRQTLEAVDQFATCTSPMPLSVSRDAGERDRRAFESAYRNLSPCASSELREVLESAVCGQRWVSVDIDRVETEQHREAGPVHVGRRCGGCSWIRSWRGPGCHNGGLSRATGQGLGWRQGALSFSYRLRYNKEL